MNGENDSNVVFECKPLTLSQCIDDVTRLLDAVAASCRDYHNATAITSVPDPVYGDQQAAYAVPLDLKTICVISAMAQAPLVLRGSTDRGKTALAERVLAGLFGPHGEGWWRMEMNRGLSVDDLIDVDVKTLTQAKLSEAISAARWLSKAGRLLDEVNRVHAKLLNLAIHMADSTGFNIRGDLSIPIGQPYIARGELSRYSFTIATANQQGREYAGVFEEDVALTRRLVVSVDLDEFPPTAQDVSRMLSTRRAKAGPLASSPLTQELINLYEALPECIPFSALATLYLHWLAGGNNCVRSKCGRLQAGSTAADLCRDCHLSKSHKFCGRVGGLSEGLLLWVKDLALAVAAVRGASTLRRLREASCPERGSASLLSRAKRFLASRFDGIDDYETLRQRYLSELSVTGEDVQAAFLLVAPGHMWVDASWLANRKDLEGKTLYVAREVARASWASMISFLQTHQELVRRLATQSSISPAEHKELERLITNQDPAILTLMAFLRDEQLPTQYREELQSGRAIRAA